jgi:hypothetical protein
VAVSVSVSAGLIAACAGLPGCADRNVGAVKVPASERAGMTARLGGGIGPVSRKVQKAEGVIAEENIKNRIHAGR